MKKFTIAALMLAIGNISTATASTDGFYLGGEFGRTQLKIAKNPINEHANSYGLYMGYQFTNWFALEGKISTTADYEFDFHSFLTDSKLTFSATSVIITPQFNWQINDTFSVFAKVGISYTKMTIDSHVTMSEDYYYDDNFLWSLSDSYDGWGYSLGTGIDTAINSNLTVRLGYDYTKVDLENNHVDSDYDEGKLDTTLSQFSLGLHYTF